jgi:hypothetical protein
MIISFTSSPESRHSAVSSDGMETVLPCSPNCRVLDCLIFSIIKKRLTVFLQPTPRLFSCPALAQTAKLSDKIWEGIPHTEQQSHVSSVKKTNIQSRCGCKIGRKWHIHTPRNQEAKMTVMTGRKCYAST